jgi:hypothetical protein
MTHDPRLATLEQVMNGNNPFELVTIPPFGAMERWRAETLLIGTTGGIQSVYDTIRADATSQAARADEAEARTALIQHVCDKITDFKKRFDALEARFTAAEDRRRTDEAAQRKLDEEEIELPPDFNRPQDLPPKPISEDAAHAPGGELHSVAAKEEPATELPEPPLEVEGAGDDMGGVRMSCRNVPTSYVRGGPKDNVGDLPKELEDPPPPVSEPEGKVYPSPTALFGNEE